MHLMRNNSTLAGTDNQRMDLCVDFARMAKVDCTFAAVPSTKTSHADTQLTSSLSEAFDLLRDGLAGSLSIVFEWRFGSQSGSGAIRDFTLPYTTVTEHYARQAIDNLIIKKIADALYEDWKREEEYQGPLHLV